MTTPDTAPMTWRPLTVGDVAAWSRLLVAAEAADRTGEHYTETDLREELADPELDLLAQSVAAFDGPGPDAEMAAFQITYPAQDMTGAGRAVRSQALVAPRYRGRGLGTALVRRGLDRAAALDAVLLVRVPAIDVAAAAVLRSAGMREVRWWSELDRDLTVPVAPGTVPEGVRIEALAGPGGGFDHDGLDEPLRAAHNVAFAGHWGSAAVTAAAWRARRTAVSAFRPDCSAVARTGDGEIAAYVLSYEFPLPGVGRELYVATVGTLPGWRGRGLAAALLTRVLATARAQGYALSSLTVDTQNATGALGLYERVGYVLDQQAVTWSS